MDDLKIIYQDDSILAVSKPPNLVSDQSSTNTEVSLAEILQKDFNINLERGGLVHRLDKDTSGILLVAKTQAALENLQDQFQTRKTKKEYLALVHGKVEDGGKIEGNIGRNPVKREKFMVMEDGKEAVTEYSPEGNFHFSAASWEIVFNDLNKIQIRKLERMDYNLFTLVKCFPLTGRTHQIRVHLKHIGHPVVADETYCGRKVFRLDKRWCPRQFLHAKKIGFYHPVTEKWMELEAPIPEDLNKALELLK